MHWWKKMQWQPWYIKLIHWEYWSFNAIYLPIVWYWVYLALKARSFFFFNAGNPSIAYGGFLMESKWDIHPLLPASHTPDTAIIRKQFSPKQVLDALSGFEFPIICKPDMGSRGRGVAIVHSKQEVLQYHQQCPLDFLLQEKIDAPMEAGIFYVRIPGQAEGFITGIVEKEFLVVRGDGTSSIRQLLGQNERFLLQLPALERLLGKGVEDILKNGEKRLLVPFGNHARGCRFIDSTHRINPNLTDAINKVCTQIPGFHFGRLDIRFKNWEALEQGMFSIVELNGAGSEPTHIYDTGWSIFRAWREIIIHWRWLYRVSKANHALGSRYLTYAESQKMFAGNKLCDKQLEHFQFVPDSVNPSAFPLEEVVLVSQVA